ncbi:hypothetical protein SAY86_011658 [Trapa natans]|uniref:Uncharacterized protein n=1 Tax=Trapa natans TaxID=22666 RepID=A0AAN7LW18_TRANT|nr:hypothetical protein SAY86_011658 [Trapa natans]
MVGCNPSILSGQMQCSRTSSSINPSIKMIMIQFLLIPVPGFWYKAHQVQACWLVLSSLTWICNCKDDFTFFILFSFTDQFHEPGVMKTPWTILHRSNFWFYFWPPQVNIFGFRLFFVQWMLLH